MKSEKMSYEEKLQKSLNQGEPYYDSMHEDYGVPDSKIGLIFWYVKNYFKNVKNNILSLVIWVVASFGITTLFSYFYINNVEPYLTSHSWKYLNLVRGKIQSVYPYLFGSDADAGLFDKFGNAYVKGFDEPWQFIYRRYEQWYDTGTYGGATTSRIAIGIFAVFFSYALFRLIGVIVEKCKTQGAKTLFKDLILIPKQVIEYGKRSNKKVFDHLLFGCFSAFIIGFIIKNPFAMPLIAFYILISFTMGSDSSMIFNYYASDCAGKVKDGEEKPLFSDSALYVWGLGTGFLLYSVLGFYVWFRANFVFGARLVETLFWLAVILVTYLVRNKRESFKLLSHGLCIAFLSCTGILLISSKAYATLLEVWYDENGNRIGQKIILDNKPDGQTYTNWLSSMTNGAGGGVGGANKKSRDYKIKEKKSPAQLEKEAKEKGKERARKAGFEQFDELTKEQWNEMNDHEKVMHLHDMREALTEAAKEKGDVDAEFDFKGKKYVTDMQNELDKLSNKVFNGKATNEDMQRINKLTDQINKYMRGDTQLQAVEEYNNQKQKEEDARNNDPVRETGMTLDKAMKQGGGKGLEYVSDLLKAFQANPGNFVDPALAKQIAGTGNKVMLGANGAITFMREYGNGDSAGKAGFKAVTITSAKYAQAGLLKPTPATYYDAGLSVHTLMDNAKLDAYGALSGQDVSGAKQQNLRIQDAIGIGSNTSHAISSLTDMTDEYIKMTQGQKNGLTTELMDDYRAGKYGENIRNMQLLIDQLSDVSEGRDVFQEWYNGLDSSHETYTQAQNRYNPTGAQSLDRR